MKKLIHVMITEAIVLSMCISVTAAMDTEFVMDTETAVDRETIEEKYPVTGSWIQNHRQNRHQITNRKPPLKDRAWNLTMKRY